MERGTGESICVTPGGGDPLCTLYQGEGLYGQVCYRGYMRDSRLKTKQEHSSHTGTSVQPRATLCTFSMVPTVRRGSPILQCCTLYSTTLYTVQYYAFEKRFGGLAGWHAVSIFLKFESQQGGMRGGRAHSLQSTNKGIKHYSTVKTYVEENPAVPYIRETLQLA